jgi:hypothetical protein
MNKPIHELSFVHCFKLIYSKCWGWMALETFWRPFGAQIDLLEAENEAHHSTGFKSSPVALKAHPSKSLNAFWHLFLLETRSILLWKVYN